MQKPEKGTYPDYFDHYLTLIEHENVLEGLEKQLQLTRNFLTEIPIEKESYRYAEGKWSIKELVGHVIDTERIMAYRALAIARGERQPLPGFDENAYAENSNAGSRTMLSLIDEYTSLRKANLLLYGTFNYAMLNTNGIANGREVTPQAIISITLGHELHHLAILRERYGFN